LPKEEKMSKKVLIITYDAPSTTHQRIEGSHNPTYYLRWFDKIHFLYWAKEEEGKRILKRERGRFIFHPYPKPYRSEYAAGLKYLGWLFRKLWQLGREEGVTFMARGVLWPGLPTVIAGKMRGRKTIIQLEAHKIDYLKAEGKISSASSSGLFFKTSLLKLAYLLTLPLCDRVIGVSRALSKEAARYRAKKACTIPFPINAAPFLAIKREDAPPGKNPNDLTLLYVGQVKAAKGVGELVEAAHILKKESGLTPKISIAGEAINPKDKKFSKKIKERSQGLKIDFLGWVPHHQLPKHYQEADIFLLPSESEGLPMVLMEAMASALPVVTTETKGASDLVQDNKNGFLIPIGDSKALAKKIKLLAETPALRRSMGRAGRARLKRLSQETDERYHQLWQELTGDLPLT
jgi:glycosyltransferase involved in cell wall biosynthesis